jgi:hypothetical protein
VWKHEARAAYFIYQLSTEGATDETVGDDDNDGGGMFSICLLHGVWMSL